MSQGVTYPAGFRAAGISAGLKPSDKLDLGLLVGEPGTVAAGLFTTNRMPAAPVVIGRTRLAATGGAVRAVLVNSGQANAATGQRGTADAEKTTAAAADLLGLAADDVLPCSTGVIGEPIHLDAMLAALPSVVEALDEGGGGDAFARAIMTTDTVPKSAQADAGAFRVGGAAKGVGMIAPNLATMLTFITTDAPVAPADLDGLARRVLQPRFEAITVDACPSTNDTVLLFASGAAAPLVAPGSDGWRALEDAVAEVGDALAAQLIADGEGVTHVLLVDVEGAGDDVEARTVARAIAESPLVKTAAFGRDPNPGRILQAVGAAGVEVDPTSVDVWIGDTQVVAGGVIPPAYFDADQLRAAAASAMTAAEVPLRVRVGSGSGRSRVLGCDLTYDYVRINGEYTT